MSIKFPMLLSKIREHDDDSLRTSLLLLLSIYIEIILRGVSSGFLVGLLSGL